MKDCGEGEAPAEPRLIRHVGSSPARQEPRPPLTKQYCFLSQRSGYRCVLRISFTASAFFVGLCSLKIDE